MSDYYRALALIRSVRRTVPGRFGDRVFYDTRPRGNRAKLQGDPAMVRCVAYALVASGIACELYSTDLPRGEAWCLVVQSAPGWTPRPGRDARTSTLLPLKRKTRP